MWYLIIAALIPLAYMFGAARARSLGRRMIQKRLDTQLQLHKKAIQKTHATSYEDGFADGRKKAEDDAVWESVYRLMHNPQL